MAFFGKFTVVTENLVKRHRIGAFLQVYNEVESGHLERFLTLNEDLFDYLFVFDDASTDGTSSVLEPKADIYLRNKTNSFSNELENKQKLLEAVKSSQLEVDWLLWLDADEVLYMSRGELEALLQLLEEKGADGARFPLLNLWRSDYYVRTDNYYGTLTKINLWKFSNHLRFEVRNGLHQELSPVSLKSIESCNFGVVHYGFSKTEHILDKYLQYSSLGQTGWALERFISEEGRTLRPVNDLGINLGERFEIPNNVAEPDYLSRFEWRALVLERRAEVAELASLSVTIISLIFQSVEWLEFIYGEMLRLQRNAPKGIKVELLVVANDATDEVLEFAKENDIPLVQSPGKLYEEEWYINSVYRAYNFGAKICSTDYVYFINSDMAFASDSLNLLLAETAEDRYLSSRLVELGRLRSGTYGIERDFGSSPRKFERKRFERFVQTIQENSMSPGGLYMPCLLPRKRFLDLGGYPEGNILSDSVDRYLICGEYEVARKGDSLVPGDRAFVLRAERHGMHHVTSFNSIAYHFQEGELKNSPRKATASSGILIANDRIIGVNGEKVLWGSLSETIQATGVKSITFDSPKIGNLGIPIRFHLRVKRFIRSAERQPRVVLGNATWRLPLTGRWRLISMRQDQVQRPSTKFLQKLVLQRSDRVVVNDAQLASTFSRLNLGWMPVPVSNIFKEPCPSVRNNRRAIFVGAFNETKGWSSVRSCLEAFPELDVCLISKYSDDDPKLTSSLASRCTIRRQLSQSDLRAEMDRASFLILGSPHETQCLAALEGAARNLPIVMPITGSLGTLPPRIRTRVGEFGSDLSSGVQKLLRRLDNQDATLQPREIVESLHIFEDEVLEEWTQLMLDELRRSFAEQARDSKSRIRINGYLAGLRLVARKFKRELVTPALRRVTKR